MASKEYEAVLRALLQAVQAAGRSDAPEEKDDIPVGISNRHIHLSRRDLDILFGPGYSLTPVKDLSQPGQFACRETVTICGPRGSIEKLRILGPVRSRTQIEVLEGDGYRLGVRSPARLSGDLAGTPGVTIVGPRGSVQVTEGMIVARRHIHMTPQDAARFGVKDGETVSVGIGGARGGVLDNVAIRATDTSALEFHIDTEEANAMGMSSSTPIKIIKKDI